MKSEEAMNEEMAERERNETSYQREQLEDIDYNDAQEFDNND